ncbi:hypothetical protein X798_04945 [Onchocerca flexuosa]|uniref:CWH43-like N-terminal domain-containing protein n=1 Tax=Onchocerca flexuosa TaxID=387005 RepID=A0A238BRZ6_9BILA|nr:hypothetical protein X798_04945 [Onchocerca flexuosa]
MESKWTEQLDNKNNRKTTYSPSPVYIKNGKTVIELFRLSPVTVFLFGFIPPRARLPSLSRIINLPLERLVWQFLVLVQTPVRIIELFTGFHRYGRLMNVNYQHKRFYEFARYVYFYAGIAELFFLIGLSLIGERENIQAHVILFYIFGFCGITFFIGNLICHRHSLYFLHPYRMTYLQYVNMLEYS